MAAKAEHLIVGSAGEDAAARRLISLGWKILARNWRPEGAAHGLELDLIAKDNATLIFVEVKTRKKTTGPAFAKADVPAGRGGASAFPAYASFTARKQRALLQAAGRYLTVRRLWHMPCRFDLICVEQAPDGTVKLEHYSNVIEFRHPVDYSHTAWQPW